MSGGSRNQVEFSQEVAEFFAPAIDSQRCWLTILAGSKTFNDRPLTPKTTTFGVDIWRLSLPTQTQCGMRYPDRVIRFERVQKGRRDAFRLAVADVGSEQHRQWRADAGARGHVATTSGDREYGIY